MKTFAEANKTIHAVETIRGTSHGRDDGEKGDRFVAFLFDCWIYLCYNRANRRPI